MQQALARSPYRLRLDRRAFVGMGSLALIASLPAHAQSRKPDWAHATVLQVLMKDYAFDPAEITLHRGVAYALRLDNVGKELHEFTAAEFFKSALVRDRHVLANGGIEVSLQPGKSAVVFLVPLKAGRYPLTCADHDWLGMTGTIVVH